MLAAALSKPLKLILIYFPSFGWKNDSDGAFTSNKGMVSALERHPTGTWDGMMGRNEQMGWCCHIYRSLVNQGRNWIFSHAVCDVITGIRPVTLLLYQLLLRAICNYTDRMRICGKQGSLRVQESESMTEREREGERVQKENERGSLTMIKVWTRYVLKMTIRAIHIAENIDTKQKQNPKRERERVNWENHLTSL